MIIHPHQTEYYELLGGKAKALALLKETGCRIPPWFAVTAGHPCDPDDIITTAKGLSCSYYAVRSSARGEDGSEHSFAGQYDTFLYVQHDDLLDRIERVQQSDQSEHLKTYQSSKHIDEVDCPTALVQRMLTPEVSGVAFSADPVTGSRDHVLVSGLWGTGSALVSGEADADVWSLDRNNKIVDSKIADKVHQHTASSKSDEGVSLEKVEPERRHIPCLTEDQLIEVATMARRCATYFNCPQDIEWAYEQGTLYLLQSRPITTLDHTPDPALPLTVWDNSNIAESYSGITSPMTFSFAERAYEYVYREFCTLLSVPKQRIADNGEVFPNMLGHIHGHVYYNLNSWYHVLAMLPGFTVNRSFMEQMMGVKEPMPDEVVQEILHRTQTTKIKDAAALIHTFIGLIKNHRSLEKQCDAFYLRLNKALESQPKPLTEMNGCELAGHYRDLESQLLKRWDAPLINDFFAMIYYGVLKSLCEKWLGDGTLQNTLLIDAGEIISAEPPRRILAMAELCADDNKLTEILACPDFSSDEKLTALGSSPPIYQAFVSYLEDFGDRCLEELKLESPTVGDNPQSLLTSIGVMAQRYQSDRMASSTPNQSPEPVADVTKSLSGIKRKLFLWVLKNTKDRVRDRENLRFERTRLFGRVRQIIVELGKRLHRENHIATPRDVFFLTISEVMGVYENTTSVEALRPTIESRKLEQASFTCPPPDRFETRGPLEHYSSFSPTRSATGTSPMDENTIQGTGACPGVVRGVVRVVTDPQNVTLQEGEILVAQQTDPGWVVLFPAASGLLVERGSLLSHSAIVARELQLPCVVSIRSITTILKSGDLIEMNGSTGEVKLLNPKP
ncbi:phosphoenolpyruvate synthase [Verrucomicrobiaceae bacterium N1E253]|uniref:Phosphoenolpyruvate synthase n=1 Tax=Oceaniferula marina TaxID=2748318 RepID=A0A851GEL6_9BACT|nr:PEP/pyruvate-binding domain-containing protein [Oceaniferula marina]NWK54161.1 phosphoenolpyruvate synthase [Oceaniferula marina]